MPTSKQQRRDPKDVLGDIQKVLEDLPEAYDYAFRPWRILWFSFLRGIAYGLGALVAVAIVVPLFIWALQRVQWVPLIGNFVSDVITQVQDARHR